MIDKNETHPFEDDLQREDLAIKFSNNLNKLSQIKHPDCWRLFFKLYQIQIIDKKEKDWKGIQAKPLSRMIGGAVSPPRELNRLRKLGFVSRKKDLHESAGNVYFSLTENGITYINGILEDHDDLINLSRAKVHAGDLPQFMNRLDEYIIIIGALAYLDNYNSSDNPPNLYDLSQSIDLKPIKVFETIKNFIKFPEGKPKKNTVPLIEIYPEKPLIKKFHRNCNDYFICNLLCRQCHRTHLELTPTGLDMCKALAKSPQDIQYKIKKRLLDKFLFFSSILSFVLSICAYSFNPTMGNYMYYWLFVIIINLIIYFVLKIQVDKTVFRYEEGLQ